MLKITQANGTKKCRILTLEGSIAGPWVAALRDHCELALRDGCTLALDLSGVGFADTTGLHLLRELLGRRVELDGRTPFIAALLDGTPP